MVLIFNKYIMKTALKTLGICLILFVTFSSCTNDDGTVIPIAATANSISAPEGAKVQYFGIGAKVGNIAVSGINIKWYIEDVPVQEVGEKINQDSNPLNLKHVSFREPLENDRMYYATQTIDGKESLSYLGVKVYVIYR